MTKRRLLSHAQVARWHRLSGVLLSVPVLAWLLSAWMMHYVVLTAPNGLQGEFRIAVRNADQAAFGEDLLEPEQILESAATEPDSSEAFWIRLDSFGEVPVYLVKPTPFSEARVFDARSGRRLDPLSDDLIRAVANQSLVGSRAVALEPSSVYHRDYLRSELPAVRVRMEGEQPSELVIARSSGRILRRIDADASRFEWWYRELHVLQWGRSMLVFTTVLYTLAGGVVLVTLLGFRLWWWRRRRQWPSHLNLRQKAVLWHRRLGLTAGIILFLQMPVGAYMWLSLGPLEDPFRGKDSINREWSGGISAKEDLGTVGQAVQVAHEAGLLADGPVQTIEWRKLDGRVVWIIQHRRDELGRIIDRETGKLMEPLDPQLVGEMARQEVTGRPGFKVVRELQFYSNRVNRPVPAVQFRFDDPAATDVFALRETGEVISRRPAFWRAFLPFFAFHTMTLTENAWVDSILLYVVQSAILALVITGFLQLRRRGSSR